MRLLTWTEARATSISVWKRGVRTKERAAIIKEKDDIEGGRQRTERRLMETVGSASEILEETQMNDLADPSP